MLDNVIVPALIVLWTCNVFLKYKHDIQPGFQAVIIFSSSWKNIYCNVYFWVKCIQYRSNVSYHLSSCFSWGAPYFSWDQLVSLTRHVSFLLRYVFFWRITEAFRMENITHKKLACISKATTSMLQQRVSSNGRYCMNWSLSLYVSNKHIKDL